MVDGIKSNLYCLDDCFNYDELQKLKSFLIDTYGDSIVFHTEGLSDADDFFFTFSCREDEVHFTLLHEISIIMDANTWFELFEITE